VAVLLIVFSYWFARIPELSGAERNILADRFRFTRLALPEVPGTPTRFEPFTLDHSAPTYDAATMAPLGAIPGDFNDDGLTDILICYAGPTAFAFLLKAEGFPANASRLTRDSHKPFEIYPRMEQWNSSAATADMDGDGQVNLIIGNYCQDGAPIPG
jgi:hypothetical protein